ncbi:hypothetical protein DFH05DRAFT_157518 [Lentinula detonsa]|uniref:SprT-like domain-containing protein n=1 Tax=Lentinula detonsa TaxID=2804962 RepID=A0A9W8PC01_9AGAR|nr:hypothetical protein DFH05DRAFT_157518 [Lentinula detonsa]
MPQGKHRTVRKTPSFIFNATATGKKDQDSRLSASNVKAKASAKRDNDEIIPDSEEEVVQQLSETSKAVENGRKNEVIIISSDEDEDGLNMPGSWSVANVQRNIVSSVAAARRDSPSSRTAKVSSKYRPSRRVIESSDDEVVEDDGNEIIELADDDEESSGSSPPRSPFKPKQLHAFRSPKLALYTDSDDSDSFSPSPLSDEALLVLDDSRNKRKPFPLRNHRGEGPSTLSTPQCATGTIFGRVNMKIAVDVQLTPVSATAMSPSRRQPRTGKKAEAAAKLERLKTYALNRFADLNEKVFDNKIPDTTKIEWNCRFTSTAGKASYRRDREGVTHSKIELAIKILDEEDVPFGIVDHLRENRRVSWPNLQRLGRKS